MTGIEYGSCPCGVRYERRGVEVKMTVAARLIKMTDVPQGRCPNCQSRVYKADVLERLESVMRGDVADSRLNR